MTRARLTPMDRQAFPSIILSVSVVCFFAVALYERDKLPHRVAKDQPPQESAPVDRGSELPVPGSPPAPGPPRTESVPGLAGKPVGPGVGRSDRTASAARPAEAPTPAIRVASKRTTEAASRRVSSRRAATPADGKLERVPFTVVGTGETIADVARRVYGRPEDAGALWRANRDILQRPDSTVAPGTVLRTPAAPLR